MNERFRGLDEFVLQGGVMICLLLVVPAPFEINAMEGERKAGFFYPFLLSSQTRASHRRDRPQLPDRELGNGIQRSANFCYQNPGRARIPAKTLPFPSLEGSQ